MRANPAHKYRDVAHGMDLPNAEVEIGPKLHKAAKQVMQQHVTSWTGVPPPGNDKQHPMDRCEIHACQRVFALPADFRDGCCPVQSKQSQIQCSQWKGLEQFEHTHRHDSG